VGLGLSVGLCLGVGLGLLLALAVAPFFSVVVVCGPCACLWGLLNADQLQEVLRGGPYRDF